MSTITAFVNHFKADDAISIMFDWNGQHSKAFLDRNLDFRRKVLGYFIEHKSEFCLDLICVLYEAETEFSREAWAIHPVVSVLAQELLERGRTKYVKEYLLGMGCGMDAYICVRMIKLSTASRIELLEYCDTYSPESNGFPNYEAIKIFKDFLLTKS